MGESHLARNRTMVGKESMGSTLPLATNSGALFSKPVKWKRALSPKDDFEHRSPPTDRVFRLINEISSLTLSETFELGGVTMKKKGMMELSTVVVLKPKNSGARIVAGAGQAQSGANEEAKVHNTMF
ncbi:unnamed protein product [Arabis nemorensis]|uniref:Uncharacterized protein n=1 Tax=Arabis nemorensis TaxID=586526 RepID=A0A565CVD8_9BRAS|nr:unnamed protein product [Arabis nemorensis]